MKTIWEHFSKKQTNKQIATKANGKVNIAEGTACYLHVHGIF